MTPRDIEVWQQVAMHHRGIKLAQLHELLPAYSSSLIYTSLQRLAAAELVFHEGEVRKYVWHAVAGRTPDGVEPAAAPAADAPPAHQKPLRPASIFQLGDNEVPSSWRDGVTRSRKHEEGERMHGEADHGFSQGAVLREAQRLAENPPALVSAPAPGAAVLTAAAPLDPSQTVTVAFPPGKQLRPLSAPPLPMFSLNSADELEITPDLGNAKPIRLDATITRALFRWLDRLGGTRLQELLQEAS